MSRKSRKKREKRKKRFEKTELEGKLEEVRTRNIIIIGIFIIGILIVVGYFYYNSTRPGKYDDFAKCLTEKGVVMYGAATCPHCREQKKLFGNSFRYVEYVECPQNRWLCNKEGITGFPTWTFSSGQQRLIGEQSLQTLARMSGCEIEI